MGMYSSPGSPHDGSEGSESVSENGRMQDALTSEVAHLSSMERAMSAIGDGIKGIDGLTGLNPVKAGDKKSA